MSAKVQEMLRKIRQKAIHQNLGKWTARTRINVGMSTCEIAAGSRKVFETFRKEIKTRKIRDVHLGQKGCVGRCHLEPTVEVFQQGQKPFKYENVDEKKAREIIKKHLVAKNAGPLSRDAHDLVSGDALTDKSRYIFGDIDYFKKQKRIVLRNCGVIDPESIDDYLAVRGYEALAKVLDEYTPERLIDEVKKSGLRGRGGGGFPTGVKWQYVRDGKSDIKYVVCNADEGDPGAFMDRSTIEGDPFSILEAMTIGAYAVGGAARGIVYIRAEYPLAVERLKIAIKQAKALNLLGNNILGTGFSFDIEIVLGAGAFVCGEETALLHSIEGERGMPRIRPPYPPEKGLWDKPTLINNVETWANIPVIILDGYRAFASLGTEKSKGTKVFALAGKVKNTGLIEVPMGTTLGEIIFDIGGGIKGDKKFKTAQTGGPSGGCLPAQFLNTPVDYESLVSAGSIMGSGGLIVMDETDCMVDVARFFLEFTQDESCGKCTPCREGTKRMLEILERIATGKGRMEDISRLELMGEVVKKTALCGLGQSAPNPVLSTLRYFRNEYEAHILKRKCPAVVCGELFASPCQHACPVNIDIPGYVGLIRQGKFRESLALILERNPLPSICGRICHHPCEYVCRRGKLDESISIMVLKRFAADKAQGAGVKLAAWKGKRRGEKIAAIGSGPSSLSAAYHLSRLGYDVTVFESEKVAGGMLSLGIPEYRLPKKIVAQDIKRITDTGVTIKTGVTVGRDITLADLRKKGYKAIYIGIGAWKERNLAIPGMDLKGVFSSLAFLKLSNTGKIKKHGRVYSYGSGSDKIVFTGKKIAVVGGGNAAMDVVRTCVRMGAAEVNLIYRRTKDSMPALPDEIREAEKEGVKFNFLVNPESIRGKDGRVAEVVLNRMKPGDFDASSRRKAVASNEHAVLAADVVVMAIGASPAVTDLMGEEASKVLTKEGTIVTDPLTMASPVDGIFAGGDITNGGATVIEAIRDGECAAISIDRYLKGEDMARDRFIVRGERKKIPYPIPEGDIKPEYRPRHAGLPASKRVRCFDEVDKLCSVKEALRESGRCLRCDRAET
ncbi:MAG: NADH-ubiquinone oxidoreductase-F iron-sulfur binding region domain-containing protein [Candidatus Omnitrophica bacterium]|nr:NADH-ubiquinone oxidoreductase-F iron-sulfur binding region domain-containing protein [Candidatus Omnitrophota bacterium]